MQPVARQLLDVGRIAQALPLGFETAYLPGDLHSLRLKLVDLPALGDVLANRVSKAQHDRAEEDGKDGCPAGETRPGAAWLG